MKQFEVGRFTVRNRTNLGQIKLEARQLEGRSFTFEAGWLIEDREMYAGEYAMVPRDENYPQDAPSWIASGDLIPD